MYNSGKYCTSIVHKKRQRQQEFSFKKQEREGYLQIISFFKLDPILIYLHTKICRIHLKSNNSLSSPGRGF